MFFVWEGDIGLAMSSPTEQTASNIVGCSGLASTCWAPTDHPFGFSQTGVKAPLVLNKEPIENGYVSNSGF